MSIYEKGSEVQDPIPALSLEKILRDITHNNGEITSLTDFEKRIKKIKNNDQKYDVPNRAKLQVLKIYVSILFFLRIYRCFQENFNTNKHILKVDCYWHREKFSVQFH